MTIADESLCPHPCLCPGGLRSILVNRASPSGWYPAWYPLLPQPRATGSPTPWWPSVGLSPQALSSVPPARAVPPFP